MTFYAIELDFDMALRCRASGLLMVDCEFEPYHL